MALSQDFILDNTFDVEIQNGDFVVGLSDQQHLALLTITNIGQWKLSPFLGFGLIQYLGGNTAIAQVKSGLQAMYESDGYTVNSITLDKTGDVINVDAARLG